ncbi:ABC transporter ATP-binding protein [Rugosimonospora acidiphila]|uniref:ABC transporter ATP-binding protein n=1 Tax=Rugosimonospora acidiphila TaxID=556531 RepID=A0ABP9RLF0_9ACTN
MNTPTTPALQIRNLSRRFGGLAALSDLSFTLAPGQILGVIGPNGAGKSTFINLVTGHLRPSTGQVLVHGADLTGKRPWRVAAAGVARTFQIVKPFRGMTARENVAISAMYGPTPRRSKRAALAVADEALERTGFTAAHTATPNELSVADARRLELAKALALRPRLLLLDEVMAGLRGKEIDRCLELVHRLREEGMTIVVVEHLMKAILSVSDQVLVLHQGRLLILGEPHAVLSDDRVIEAYLGQRYVQRKAR